MRKILFLSLALFLLSILIAESEISGNLYPLAGTVVEVNRPEDTVTVQDGAGNLWRFDGAEDWQPGDLAALLMNDCGTEDVRDDVILQVRYAGRGVL